MRLPVLQTVDEVVARQLCCGCGACAGVEPDRYEMIDTLAHGRRPRRRPGAALAGGGGEAMQVCPGADLAHDGGPDHPEAVPELRADWGPVLEVWEGHATDRDVRRAASSGGAATAIAGAMLDAEGFHGVLHVRARRDVPLLNETVLTTSSEDLLAATGSRYAPASPCEGLPLVEAAPARCVVIGKPCDIAAVHKATRRRPALGERVGLTIAIFCAGTPTTRATLRLLERLGVDDPADVLDLRYRGNGWPGRATALVRTRRGIESRSLSYDEAWGEVLTNDKQWRCHVCADHSGEFADIAVGDPWHRPIEAGDPGRSLIVVRTERGRTLLRAAVAAGALQVRRARPEILPAAQPALARARGAVWGRILACRLRGVPAPRYRNIPLHRAWWRHLSWRDKARSIVGTIRRIRRRGLERPITIEPWAAAPSPRAPRARAPRRRAA